MEYNYKPPLLIEMPGHMNELCSCISSEFGTVPELAIPMFITILSSLLQGKFDAVCEINGEQIMRTPLTMFTMVITESGTGKTPVTRKLLEPLDIIIKEENKSIDRKNILTIEMNKIIGGQIRTLRRLAEKRNEEDVASALKEIITLKEKCEIPKAYIIPYVNNGTEAGIRKFLSEQEGNRISILDSDGGSTKLLLQDTRLTSILNQCYDHEVITVARAGKFTTETLHGYISWATYMQPAKFERLAHKQDLWMDGCLVRVLPFFFGDHITTNVITGKSVPASVYDYYVNKLDYLVKYHWNRDENGNIIPYMIKLNPEAANIWKMYAEDFERMASDYYREIAPWLIKCKATLLKLAAIFHVYETVDSPEHSFVEARHVDYAYRLLRELIPYVEYLKKTVAPTPEEAVMKKIIHWLYKQYGHEDFKIRDLYQGTGLRKGPVAPCIISLLEQGVLLEWEERDRRYRGRPPSRGFTLDYEILCHLYPEDY